MAKVVLGLVRDARGSAFHHAEMTMRVDNQRHHGPAMHVDSFGVGRCVRLLGCDRPNAVAFDNYCSIWLRWRTGAIYHVYIL